MASPRWLHLGGACARLAAQGIGTFFLWTVWLALCLALVLQVFIGLARELPVPEFALRRIEQRLAAAGLQATFGSATFDPGGHVLVTDLRVSLGSLPEPVLTAELLSIDIDPWALLVRLVEIDTVELHGAELRVPALLSPSGRTEPVIRDLRAVLRPSNQREGLAIPHLAARIGSLHVLVQGELVPTAERPPSRPVDEWLEEAARLYPRLSRQLANAAEAWPLSDGRLQLDLTPDRPRNTTLVRATLSATRISGGRLPEGVSGTQVDAGLDLHLPASRQPAGAAWTATLALGTATSPKLGDAHDLKVLAHGTMGASWADPGVKEIELAAARLTAAGVEFGAPLAQLNVAAWPAARGSATAHGFNETWALAGTIDGRTRMGELAVAGRVTSAALAHVGQRLGRDLTALLTCEQPPHLDARITLGPQGRPSAATARVRSGPLIARGVALAGASGSIQWRGETLRADEIRLITASSEARGRYEMDLRTRAFRFLLEGRLQPGDIDGWFRDWWPRFWSRFEFSAPPEADVEVRGRWGRPRETSVFVVADGAPVTLQGAAFDRIRTRLVVRPGFIDVIDFIGNRGQHEARGSFSRTASLANGQWTQLSFDVQGDTDLEPAGHLFGELGASIVRPFRFSTPPRLHVRGALRNATPDRARSVDVRINGTADGPWAFHQFPLEGLQFRAHLQDDSLLIEDLAAGFAGGRGTGRAEIRGWSGERQLAFDVTLADARLGESIRTVETWSAARHHQPPPPVSRFQQQVAAGQLDLDLSATGRYDDPYSLHGAGHAVITGAELGEINLLGILSALLRPTIFNFTTLQLDTALANFDLVGNTLEFHELRLSGARAAIEAQGGYRLDNKSLSFAAKIHPFDLSESFLGATFGLVLAPLSTVLEVKLTGVLDQPSWAFVYGPTNFFRVLSGESTPADAPPPAPRP